MYNLRSSTTAQRAMLQELAAIKEQIVAHAISHSRPLSEDELHQIEVRLFAISSTHQHHEECTELLEILSSTTFNRHSKDGATAVVDDTIPDNTVDASSSPSHSQSQSVFAGCDQDWLRQTYFSCLRQPGSQSFSSETVNNVSPEKCVKENDLVDASTQCSAVESAEIGIGTDAAGWNERFFANRPDDEHLIVLSFRDVDRIANSLKIRTEDLYAVIRREQQDYQIEEADVEYLNEVVVSSGVALTPDSSDISAISATPPGRN